jgi:hydroxymethylbilane synthase
MNLSLTIATRQSRLALWQAEHVKARLEHDLGATVTLLPLSTRGDEILDRSLSKVGGKGLFVKELEVALAQGEADLAVHSLKDVPMDLPEGYALAAILEREDPRDAWVSPHHASLDAVPTGARIGTSSLRRQVQLLARRPDLDIQPLRGNLDTRLRKLDGGEYAGIVLARAGLVRLGLGERVREAFAVEAMLPCAGQGALGIEVLSQRADLIEQLGALRHAPTHLACSAERAVSRALGGSCSVPLAAHATWSQGTVLRLRAVFGALTPGGARTWRAEAEASVTDAAAAESLGVRVAAMLREQGVPLDAPLG